MSLDSVSDFTQITDKDKPLRVFISFRFVSNDDVVLLLVLGGRFKKEVVLDGQSYLLLIRDEGGLPEMQVLFQHQLSVAFLLFWYIHGHSTSHSYSVYIFLAYNAVLVSQELLLPLRYL